MERTRSGEHSGAAVVAPDFQHTRDDLGALTAALCRERELLEQLLFALTCQRLLLHSGSLRWLAVCTVQVHDVLDLLREQEVMRAIVTEALTSALDQPASSSLSELAALVPEPYPAILGDLLAALRELSTEVDETVRINDELLLGIAARTANDGAL